MKSSLHIPTEMMLRQMDLWYRTPLGACFLEAEKTAISPLWEDCFGKQILQIGGPGEVLLFPSNPIFHFVRLSPERVPVFRGPSVRASFEELPFLPESVDIVFLPHVLESVPHPQVILTQIQAVLAPEGRLIILGFNPRSLWGLIRHGMRHKTLPWRSHFRSISLIKKWLSHHEFIVEETRTLFFRPPLKTAENLRRCSILETLGQLFLANNGATYLIVARKRMLPLTPVKPSLTVQLAKVASL